MATKIYNFTNQRLNADKLREVQKFNSDNFGGIIASSSPITINGNMVTLNASEENPVMMMGGGSLLEQVSIEDSTLSNEKELWYLQVSLNKDSSSVIRDTLIDSISFNKILCDYMNKNSDYTFFSVVTEAEGSPNYQNYYEYDKDEHQYKLSTHTAVEDGTVYYYKIEASNITFRFYEAAPTYTYLGNSIWLDNNTFIIPLCAYIDGKIETVVSIRQVQDLEGLLSAEAYAKLKKYCETTFVWTVGGREEVTDINGNTHKKGDVGNLNITGDTIYNSINYGTEDDPDYMRGPVGISNLYIRNLESSNNTKDTKLVVDQSGNISSMHDYITPISHGGTGSSTINGAKNSLGIRWGENGGKSPKEQSPYSNPSDGDIYLWIIE